MFDKQSTLDQHVLGPQYFPQQTTEDVHNNIAVLAKNMEGQTFTKPEIIKKLTDEGINPGFDGWTGWVEDNLLFVHLRCGISYTFPHDGWEHVVSVQRSGRNRSHEKAYKFFFYMVGADD